MVAVIAIGISGTFALADDSFDLLKISETVDQTQIYGHVEAILYDEFGNVKAYTQSDNKIVNVGLDTLLVNILQGTTISGMGASNNTLGPITHMQLGTETVEAGSGNTTIGTISNCIPDAVAAAYTSTGIVVITGVFSVGGQGAGCQTTINEAGLFSGPTGGGSGDTMFAQNAFGSGVPLGASDSLTVNWTFTFSDT